MAAGALSTRLERVAVANSLGVGAVHERTQAHFHVVMLYEDSAGYAAAEGMGLSQIDTRAVADRAAMKALQGANPRHIRAEPMPAIFEPVAAAELLRPFVHGFSALAYQEQRSFTCDLLGSKACAEQLNIIDDAADPRTYTRPFDWEGVPKQRVELVREGVISELLYDSYTAGREQPPRASTGHAAPPPGRWGPVPENVIVLPGRESLDELIASVDRGLLVSRVHYLNVVHPRKLILTGMTREGTFLIENGQTTHAVHNLRFTQPFVEALGRLQAMGADGELHGGIWTPALLIDGFCFTSETQF